MNMISAKCMKHIKFPLIFLNEQLVTVSLYIGTRIPLDIMNMIKLIPIRPTKVLDVIEKLFLISLSK